MVHIKELHQFTEELFSLYTDIWFTLTSENLDNMDIHFPRKGLYMSGTVVKMFISALSRFEVRDHGHEKKSNSYNSKLDRYEFFFRISGVHSLSEILGTFDPLGTEEHSYVTLDIKVGEESLERALAYTREGFCRI